MRLPESYWAGITPVIVTQSTLGAGVFILGVSCVWLHIERSAYRYAGITLEIVMLVAQAQPTWIIAIHRFLEISVGIAVGLAFTPAWPEPRPDGV